MRCACAGSCGGVNDHRLVDADRGLETAKASNDPIAIETAATAVEKAQAKRKRTSRRKRDAGASGAPAAPGRTYRALACWARVWAVFDSRSQGL